ncbi:hypothetical protein MMC21_006272 [Puttea exsequens]|nr:hypothetical protein [Puttea exsequens]
MATQVQQNLEKKNTEYASSFKDGDLALPPAKKYTIGQPRPPTRPKALRNYETRTDLAYFQSPAWTPGSIQQPVSSKSCRATQPETESDCCTAYGIDLGDAHVIRNAGGNARDSIRSLVISEQLLGTTEILLIKHTGCGMLTFSNEAAHAVVEKNLGSDAEQELSGLDFQPFPDLEKGVEDDVKFLKASKAIPNSITITGWVYEIETGKVRKIV